MMATAFNYLTKINRRSDSRTQLIRDRFEDAGDFSAQSIFVVTWNNVGYFNRKSDLLNSFQVVLIWSGEEAYTQFLYPQGGINWVQAETGDSGLPDVRAQAGFVSEDGRFYQLRGSGSENVNDHTSAIHRAIDLTIIFFSLDVHRFASSPTSPTLGCLESGCTVSDLWPTRTI